MADTIYEVGSGKAYDTAAGLINAINDLPTDMNTVDGHQIIKIWPDYDYNWISADKTLNPSNPSVNKKIIIKAADGYEHKGVFESGVRIVFNTANSKPIFNLRYNYAEIRDLEWEIGANNNREFRIFDIYGTSVLLQNLLVQQKGGSGFLFYWRTGSSGFQNNCIAHSTVTSLFSYLFVADGGSSVIEVNDNIGYGNIAYYGGNAAGININNSGLMWVIAGLTNYFQAFAGSTSRGNYHNDTASNPTGSNPLKISVSSAKFQDIANKNFKLKIDSPLINTGSMKSANNPYDIAGNPWNANHRSPYNNIVITNIFMSPPEDIEYVRGNHNNGLVFNVLSPGRDALVGQLEESNQLSTIGYSQAGYITKCLKLGGVNTRYTLTNGLYGKRFTASAIAKDVGVGSGLYFISKTGFSFGVNNTNKIEFVSGAYTCIGSLDTYITITDYFHAILYIDLEKNTDAERVKIYVFQKGALYQVALTFSGTAPTSLSIGNDNWEIGLHSSYQGVTTIWDRCLSYDELYTLGYDPYIIYRSDKKFFRLIDLIKEYVVELWRHKSQLFGPSTTMTGTSTMVA